MYFSLGILSINLFYKILGKKYQDISMNKKLHEYLSISFPFLFTTMKMRYVK